MPVSFALSSCTRRPPFNLLRQAQAGPDPDAPTAACTVGTPTDTMLSSSLVMLRPLRNSSFWQPVVIDTSFYQKLLFLKGCGITGELLSCMPAGR